MKMKPLFYSAVAALMLAACGGSKSTPAGETVLKEVFGHQFLMGVAVNARQANGTDSLGQQVVKKHFNAIVAEDCMKSVRIHPEIDRYDFGEADEFVQFGEENGLTMTGHCLVWHSQLSPWFCVDDKGNPISADELKHRMKDHITTVVSRYKGKLKGWDVVNEAFEDDGSWRKTPFYEILGEEYLPLAFEYAHEADPDAELYYNDYGMHHPGRKEAVVRMVKHLKERGIRIDAVGFQGHIGMDYPDFDVYEQYITDVAACGVKILITELDMSALPTVHQAANITDTVAYQAAINPYPDGLPDSVSVAWNARMSDLFRLFVKHADVIDRVTAWGVSDGDSWKNDFPVRGRKEYPLLFDRSYQMKPFLKEWMNGK